MGTHASPQLARHGRSLLHLPGDAPRHALFLARLVLEPPLPAEVCCCNLAQRNISDVTSSSASFCRQRCLASSRWCSLPSRWRRTSSSCAGVGARHASASGRRTTGRFSGTRKPATRPTDPRASGRHTSGDERWPAGVAALGERAPEQTPADGHAQMAKGSKMKMAGFGPVACRALAREWAHLESSVCAGSPGGTANRGPGKQGGGRPRGPCVAPWGCDRSARNAPGCVSCAGSVQTPADVRSQTRKFG